MFFYGGHAKMIFLTGAVLIAAFATAQAPEPVLPAAPFTPMLEYDGGGAALCETFLGDVRADYFEGAPGAAKLVRHRKAPPVFADPLSDMLVEAEDPEAAGYDRLTRYWGDIDGDGTAEEVAMTTYVGDGASGYRVFAGLTKLNVEGVAAVREEWRRLFKLGYQDEWKRWKGRADTINRHILQDTYIFVVDYGASTGPNKRFWKRPPILIRDLPADPHLKSVVEHAVNYRLPFRLVDYEGRLFAETIVDYGWNGNDKNSIAARRVLLSFDGEMHPRPECIAAELPDQDFPTLLLRQSQNLQTFLTVIEAIAGGNCDGGSLNIYGNHQRHRRSIVREVTARPWLLSQEKEYPSRFASKNFARKPEHQWLRTWRFLGPWNAVQFQKLAQSGAAARGDLRDYYQREFGVDREIADGWATNAGVALEKSAALGAASRYRRLEPLADRVGNGDATTKDFVELSRGLLSPYPNEEVTEETVLTGALRLASLARADPAILESLISMGASLDGGDETPLMNAAGDSETAQALIRLGADIEKPNSLGKTPLMTAAHLDSLDTARLLLKHGAEVNTKTAADPGYDGIYCSRINITGRTALMYAAENGSLKLVRALLDAGADATAVDSRNRGALDYLSRNTALSPRDRKVASRALMKHGAER